MRRGQGWMLIGMLLASVAIAQPRAPVRKIIPISGDLYRARINNWYAIFLVTPEGRRHRDAAVFRGPGRGGRGRHGGRPVPR